MVLFYGNVRTIVQGAFRNPRLAIGGRLRGLTPRERVSDFDLFDGCIDRVTVHHDRSGVVTTRHPPGR